MVQLPRLRYLKVRMISHRMISLKPCFGARDPVSIRSSSTFRPDHACDKAPANFSSHAQAKRARRGVLYLAQLSNQQNAMDASKLSAMQWNKPRPSIEPCTNKANPSGPTLSCSVRCPAQWIFHAQHSAVPFFPQTDFISKRTWKLKFARLDKLS